MYPTSLKISELVFLFVHYEFWWHLLHWNLSIILRKSLLPFAQHFIKKVDRIFYRATLSCRISVQTNLIKWKTKDTFWTILTCNCHNASNWFINSLHWRKKTKQKETIRISLSFKKLVIFNLTKYIPAIQQLVQCSKLVRGPHTALSILTISIASSSV